MTQGNIILDNKDHWSIKINEYLFIEQDRDLNSEAFRLAFVYNYTSPANSITDRTPENINWKFCEECTTVEELYIRNKYFQ